MKHFNIYRIETEGEIKYIYAKGDLLEVLKWYTKEFCLDLEDIDSITLLPREKWSEKILSIPTPEDEIIEQTFEEYVRNSNSNEVISSTQWS